MPITGTTCFLFFLCLAETWMHWRVLLQLASSGKCSRNCVPSGLCRWHWDQCLLEMQGKIVLCSLPTHTHPSLLPQTRWQNFPSCNPLFLLLLFACIGQQTRWTIAIEHNDNYLQLSFWGSLKFSSFKFLSHTSNRDLFWGSHRSFQQDNTRFLFKNWHSCKWKYRHPSFRLFLLFPCNQLSGYFQKVNLTEIMWREWTMPVTQLPCLRPAQPLLVSLQAINSAQNHSSSYSKMPFDGIGTQAFWKKNCLYFKGSLFFSIRKCWTNKRQ